MVNQVNDIIKEFWVMITGAISIAVWMIRLEGKAALNSVAIRQLEKMREEDLKSARLAREEDLKSAREAREDTSKRLGEIRDDLGEIQKDIKELIRAAK